MPPTPPGKADVQALFDHAPDGIFIADLDMRYTDVNVVACEMLGYSRDELIGKTILEIISPVEIPRLAALRADMLSSGAVQIAEWTLFKKDGTSIPVEVSSKILPDGRWLAFVRNIRERKLIEARLHDANASLDAIIENIPLMLFIKDASLRFVRFNRAGADLLGWSSETFIGKSDSDYWPREQADFFVEKDLETLRVGKVVDIEEEPIQTRHQGVRLLHTKKVPIFDTSGKPQYLLGISEDITERKRIEEERRLLADVSVALSASLDYEQTLATVTQMAVARVADWCCIDVLEEGKHLTRLKVASADPAQTQLCAVLEGMPPDRELPYLAQSVLESGRSLVIEHVTPAYLESVSQGPEHLQLLRSTGVTSLIAVPLLLRGKALGVLMFASSSPQRVYGQRDLRWAEALADRSAVAIENARLYRASVEASQLRDQVLGVVAHDLRNPLSTILMQEVLLRERRGSSERELDTIHRAATRMNRLIQDLVDVTTMEAGELAVQKARLSARDLVAEAVELLKGLAASVDLQMDVPSDGPEFWGDRDRLLQVFENLIGNAIKFTAPGGPITVGAASKDHEVVFWVADGGRGIAPDDLPHVFDRFWQAARDRRGAGLGLAIVRGIVEAHGGRVWVESTLGRGSTFFFSVPEAS